MFIRHTEKDWKKNSITFIGYERIETDAYGNITLYDSDTGHRFCDIYISDMFKGSDASEFFPKGETQAFFLKKSLF